MARNVLIFSDGTGQVGGYMFDEDRTNIYKLYRGTRICPDSCINPHEQIAFYDPGLGSRGEGGGLRPSLHPAMERVPVEYEPKGLGEATGRGAEPSA